MAVRPFHWTVTLTPEARLKLSIAAASTFWFGSPSDQKLHRVNSFDSDPEVGLSSPPHPDVTTRLAAPAAAPPRKRRRDKPLMRLTSSSSRISVSASAAPLPGQWDSRRRSDREVVLEAEVGVLGGDVTADRADVADAHRQGSLVT